MSESDDLYNMNLKIEKLEASLLNLENRLEYTNSLLVSLAKTSIETLEIMKHQNEGNLSIAKVVASLNGISLKEHQD